MRFFYSMFILTGFRWPLIKTKPRNIINRDIKTIIKRAGKKKAYFLLGK